MSGRINGVEYWDLKISGGPPAAHGDIATVLYKLALSEENLGRGELLESTYSPDVFVDVIVDPSQLLAGVYQALVGMRSGGSVRRVRVPADLAYGDRGWGVVPRNAELWVDLCLSRISAIRAA